MSNENGLAKVAENWQKIIKLSIAAGFAFLAIFVAGPAKSAEPGDCFCKPYDDNAGTYGAEEYLDYVTDQANCNGIYLKDLDQAQYATLQPQSDRYKNCARVNDETLSSGKATFTCLDTKAQCRWEVKTTYCCCKADSSGKISQCAVANNYKNYSFCNSTVISANGEKVDYWNQGTCTCPSGMKNYPTVVMDIKYFTNLNCASGAEGYSNLQNCRFQTGGNACICEDHGLPFITQSTPGRLSPIDTCLDKGKDTDTIKNCRYSADTTQCLCQIYSTTPDKNFSIGYNEYACKAAKCSWAPSYSATEEGFTVKSYDDSSCATYSPAAGGGAKAALTVESLRQDAKKELSQTNFANASQIIGAGIKVLVSYIGSIAIVLYIYAGLMYMFSAGNTERVGKSKQIFLWVSLGLLVMIGSYVIVGYLFSSLLPSQ